MPFLIFMPGPEQIKFITMVVEWLDINVFVIKILKVRLELIKMQVS